MQAEFTLYHKAVWNWNYTPKNLLTFTQHKKLFTFLNYLPPGLQLLPVHE